MNSPRNIYEGNLNPSDPSSIQAIHTLELCQPSIETAQAHETKQKEAEPMAIPFACFCWMEN